MDRQYRRTRESRSAERPAAVPRSRQLTDPDANGAPLPKPLHDLIDPDTNGATVTNPLRGLADLNAGGATVPNPLRDLVGPDVGGATGPNPLRGLADPDAGGAGASNPLREAAAGQRATPWFLAAARRPEVEDERDGSLAGWLLRNREAPAANRPDTLAGWLLRQRETPGEVQAAAEDPRIFDLLRVIEQDELREHGLEVETRPERIYERRWPGARADGVRLDYHGVGKLQVATHAHDGIRTRGLGLMFPAHTVHARNSSAVVVGNDCELTQVDHVHIRQAVIADDDALRSPQIERILKRAVPGRNNSRVVRDLRAALARLVERPEANGPARAERRLRADCTAEIYDCDSVQLGDDAMTRLDSHYVVERTVIPAGALLADDEDLARRYVDVATGEAGDPGALAGFLCDLVGAAENSTDENVLGYADGLPRQPATLLGLFGMATIDNMTSIMIGTGNTLHTELDLTTAPVSLGDGIADRLSERQDELREAATPDPRRASPEAEPAWPEPSSWNERLEQGW